MSQQNVELAAIQFRSTDPRPFVGVMDTWAEDVTLEVHSDVGPFGGKVEGKAAVARWFGDWYREFDPDYRFDVEELRDFGDRVFVVARHHGRGRQSGVKLEQSTTFVFTLHEGKVRRMELWPDRMHALEAAGLRE
jgi:ketosteroid isomerase-like protein